MASRSYTSALRMARLFGNDAFWQQTLPYLAIQEPAVQYALEALCCLHGGGGQYLADDTSTLTAYNLSIRHLGMQQNILKSGGDFTVVLVVCALFICIEFSRGETRNGLHHVRSGLHILKEQTEYCRSHGVSPWTKEQLADISALFWRLRVQLAVYEPRLFPKDEVSPYSNASTTASLYDAKRTGFNLFTIGMAFLSRVQELDSIYDVPLRLVEAQKHILGRLDHWKISFDNLVSRMQLLWDTEERLAANVLKIQCEGISLWVANSFELYQTSFDKCEDRFERIIKLAEETVPQIPANFFCMDMGIIAVLHLIGVKCRMPRLRRRILRALGSKRWKEGSYDSFVAYRVVHRQMIMEEAKLNVVEFPEQVPDERDRILLSNMMSMMRADAKNDVLNLQLMVLGDDGLPKISTELIPLKGELPSFVELN
jgi:hypothetical protein